MEIHWLEIQSRTGFSASVIMKNFNVLMNYLTNPFQWVLKMPQFPSSKMVCTILRLSSTCFIWWRSFSWSLYLVLSILCGQSSKKGYLALYRSLFFWMMVLPVVACSDDFYNWFWSILYAFSSGLICWGQYLALWSARGFDYSCITRRLLYACLFDFLCLIRRNVCEFLSIF